MSTSDYVQGKFLPGLGVQSVLVTDLVTVQVQFNDSLESESSQNIANYSITDASGINVPVNSATLNGSDTILLGTAFLGNVSQYTLTIKNVAGTGATQTIPPEGISAVFTGLGADSPQFGIQTVIVKDLVTLQVKFNDTLDQASATTPENYTIFDPSNIGISVTAVTMAPNSVDTVLITTSYLSNPLNYTLMVKNVFGTGVKLPLSSDGATITFPGLGSASPQFGIQTVAVANLNTLTIKFNDALDVIANNAATAISNYTIVDSANATVAIIAATYNPLLPDTIVLSTGYLSNNTNYTLTVKNVKGVSVMLALPASGATITFPGMGSASPSLGIKSLQVIDLITLRVEFNNSVDSASAETLGNYTLKDPGLANIPVQNATMVSGSLTMVDIKTSNIASSYFSSASNYTLTVKNVASTGVMLPLPTAGVQMTFPGMGVATPQLGIQSVAMVGTNVVEITYNYNFDTVAATTVSNYQIFDMSNPSVPVAVGLNTLNNPIRKNNTSNNTVDLFTSANLTNGVPYTLIVNNILPGTGVLALPISTPLSMPFTGVQINVVTADTSAPVFLTPLDQAITSNTVQVVWTSAMGAVTYTLEICTDTLCNNHAATTPASPITILAPTTSAIVTLPSSGTYTLRVSSNLSSGTAFPYTAITINSLDNYIYVYCPGTTVNCSDAGAMGNIAKPYQTISGAINAAISLGKKDIRVASRDAIGTAYNEAIMLKDGINLHGGWNSAFTVQDMVNNKTTLTSTGTLTVFARDIFAQTLVEGFNLTNTSGLDISYTLKTDNCTSNLKFQNIVVTGSDITKSSVTTTSTTLSYAVHLSASSPAFATGTIINAGSISLSNVSAAANVNTFGVYNSNMSMPSLTGVIVNLGAITQDTINASDTAISYGIYNLGALPTIANSTINMGMATHTNNFSSPTSRLYGIYNDSGSSATINGNTINAPTLNSVYSTGVCQYTGSSAVIFNNTSSPTISNNTINAGNGEYTAILTTGNSAPTINANTIHGNNIYFNGIVNVNGTSSVITTNTIDFSTAPVSNVHMNISGITNYGSYCNPANGTTTTSSSTVTTGTISGNTINLNNQTINISQYSNAPTNTQGYWISIYGIMLYNDNSALNGNNFIGGNISVSETGGGANYFNIIGEYFTPRFGPITVSGDTVNMPSINIAGISTDWTTVNITGIQTSNTYWDYNQFFSGIINMSNVTISSGKASVLNVGFSDQSWNASVLGKHITYGGSNSVINGGTNTIASGATGTINNYGINTNYSKLYVGSTTINMGSTTVAAGGTNLGSSTIGVNGYVLQLYMDTINAGTDPQKTIGANCANKIYNSIITGGGGGANSYGIYNCYGSQPFIYNNYVDAGSGTNSYGIYNEGTTTSGSTYSNIKNNSVYGGSGSTSYGIYNTSYAFVGSSTTTTYSAAPYLYNNVINAGSGTSSYGIYNRGSLTTAYNNTVLSNGSATAYGVYNSIYNYTNHLGQPLSISQYPLISGNLITTSGSGIKYGIYELDANSDTNTIKNNNLFDFGAGAYVFYYDFDNNCGGSGLGNNCTLAQMEALADISTKSGNTNLDPVFIASPAVMVQPNSMDITWEGPDANATYDGTLNTIEVMDCQDGRYVVGNYIEYSNDGVARQITSVNCTATTSTITFTPALAATSTQGPTITLWGNNNLNTGDYLIQASSPCNIKQGGLNFSTLGINSFTTDKASSTRTATLTCSPTNTGAAGWSMGAFENDY